jgi:hypothetical protein
MFMHATLTPKVGGMSALSDTVARLVRSMPDSMRLLGAYQTVSGAPGRIIDIWELDEANTITDALEAAAQHPKHQATMDRVAEVLVLEQLKLVEATTYSPPFRGGGSGPFMHATLRTRYGQAARASAVVAELRDVLEEHLDWRLVGAWRTVIGNFGEIFDLWELPEGRTLDDMLAEARTIPAFAAAAKPLPDLIDGEDILTLRPTAYCP